MIFKYKFLIFSLLYYTTIIAQPTNNAIFKGGIGDGWNTLSNNSVSNTIFVGGVGDGWNTLSNNSVSNTIFVGGVGDGWNTISNNSVSNTIFKGGSGDGWHVTSYSILENSIFYGGVGDGWSAVVIPLGPLPVSLLSFTGQQINAQHVLNWQTSSEANSSHFELQYSPTGVSFATIGSVLAQGQSNVLTNYTYTHTNPTKGNNYYRLKQIDKDGKYKYSNIILLRILQQKASVLVYPNPTAEVLNIVLSNYTNTGNVTIKIYDVQGKLITNNNFKKDNTNITINVTTMAKGIYTLQINDNNDISTIKFIKH